MSERVRNIELVVQCCLKWYLPGRHGTQYRAAHITGAAADDAPLGEAELEAGARGTTRMGLCSKGFR